MTERGWGREGEGYNIYTNRERDTHTYMHTERECGKGREFRGSIVMQTSSINIWQRGWLKQGSEWYRQEYIKVSKNDSYSTVDCSTYRGPGSLIDESQR